MNCSENGMYGAKGSCAETHKIVCTATIHIETEAYGWKNF